MKNNGVWVRCEILGKIEVQVHFLKICPGALTFSSDFIGMIYIVVYFYAQT